MADKIGLDTFFLESDFTILELKTKNATAWRSGGYTAPIISLFLNFKDKATESKLPAGACLQCVSPWMSEITILKQVIQGKPSVIIKSLKTLDYIQIAQRHQIRPEVNLKMFLWVKHISKRMNTLTLVSHCPENSLNPKSFPSTQQSKTSITQPWRWWRILYWLFYFFL